MSTKDLVPQLDTIIAARREALRHRKAKTPIEAIRALASMQKRPQPVLNSVSEDAPVMLIGQIKYTMPQTGNLGDPYDPVATALRFTHTGADAVSLYTNDTLYQDGLDDMVLISRAISLPVISQDYVLDEYQVVEMRAAGASALVLSATILDQALLRTLVSATHRNRMTAIVEVTNEAELEYAISLSPYVIGISNRNPNTRITDIETAFRLRPLIPASMRVMITDGLKSIDEVAAIVPLDVDAIVIRDSVFQDAYKLPSLLKRPKSNGS